MDLSEVTDIRLLGPRRCEARPSGCEPPLGFVVRVQLSVPGREPVQETLTCGGGGIGWMFNELCSNAPPVFVTVPDRSGHGDIPCPGEPPDGCTTPVPSIDPGLLDRGVPLRIPTLSVPLDHVGAYEVPVGLATLPNGMLTEASLDLVEMEQVDFLLEDGRVYLQIFGEDGDELGFGYTHDRQDGLSQVEARIVFEVTSYEPGTVLHFRNVVVR